MRKNVGLAASLLLSVAFAQLAGLAAVSGTPATIDELKADRVKSLSKRDPRADELLKKALAKVEAMKAEKPDSTLVIRLQNAIEQIQFGSASISAERVKQDMELLEAIVKEHKEPSAEELAPLQERYKKLCAQFDDIAFSKDLDRAFHVHDKLVRFTSLGLWDKDKISSELERMEGMVERAPDIAFGKSQLLDTCKNKRLASVAKLVYTGSSSHEEMYLTGDRRSVALIDEGGGQEQPLVKTELAEHYIQGPDGKFSNLNDCNDAALGLPFSPPLTLWAKTRMQLGRVPAVLLKLVDSKAKSENSAFASSKAEFISIADILDSKLDDYLKTNAKLIGPEKTPALLGLFSEFDRDAAATAFGADGRTPYYFVLDQKLKDMPEPKRSEEVKKRIDKGTYAGSKGASAELSNKYGDASIPDGPERVRDAWKRIHKILGENGASSVSLFSVAGSFHGNKNASKFPGEQDAGNQAWNKLEYYWPGEGVIDWLGINAVGSDPANDPKGANLMEALDTFMAELRSSNWQATPVMLVNLAPGRIKQPLQEGVWVTTVFTKMIPATFPNILCVFVDIPGQVTFWTGEGRSAFRSYVSSSKFYNFPMRFKSLNSSSGAAPAAQ